MATDKATSRAGQRLRMLVEQLRREARAEGHEITQVALGQRLGIGETTLSKILNGTRNAGPDIVESVHNSGLVSRDFFYEEHLKSHSYRDYPPVAHRAKKR